MKVADELVNSLLQLQSEIVKSCDRMLKETEPGTEAYKALLEIKGGAIKFIESLDEQ